MKKFLVELILCSLIISCAGKPIKPKPKSMLDLNKEANDSQYLN